MRARWRSRRPARHHDGTDDDGEQHGRVEVGLEAHEGTEAEEHEEQRAEHTTRVVQLVGSTREQIGGEQHERELGELARLEPPRADAEPAARPADVDADLRDEHEGEEHAADDEERPHRVRPAVVVDPDDERERDDAEQRPDELAHEEVPRVAVARQRHDRGCRQHHHDADDHEDADRPHEEHVVRRARLVRRVAVDCRSAHGSARARGARRRRHRCTSTSARTSSAKSSPRAA